jgi:DNA-binding beta-propeller fold protein YncE
MSGRYRVVQRIAVCIALVCACVVGVTPALASWPAQPSLVETITTSGGPFGAAMSPNGAQAWFTAYNGNSVRFFDTTTRQELPGSPLSVGTTPWDVVFSPDGNRAWVSNYQVASSSGTGTTVSIIDTASSPPTVTGAVTVGTGPQGMAISPDGTRLWVANYASANVTIIDTTSTPPIAVATVSLPGTYPTAVAISPDGSRALVTDYLGNVYVISTSTFAVLGNAAIGSTLVDIIFNNDGTRAWVSGIRVYSIDTSTSTPALLNTSTISAAGGLALAPDGSRLWVVAHFGNAIDVIDPITLQAFSGARLTFGQQPYQVILTPSGTMAWVSGFLNDTIGVVSTGYVPGGSDDPSQRPLAPLQEFAVVPGTAADQCSDLAPDSVDWPALVSLRQVGWTLSYASWPHGGTGGWVCSRQPVYISGAWTFSSIAS